jgi:hypothetical protein
MQGLDENWQEEAHLHVGRTDADGYANGVITQ